MTEWTALAELAVYPQPGRQVAISTEGVLDHVAFRAQVARWKWVFERSTAGQVALYFEETAAFLPALYGAWHAGKSVLLCADNLPATVEGLAAQVLVFAGDFPAHCAPLSASAHDVDDGSLWPALDEQVTRLQVYTSGSTGQAQAIDKKLAQLAREVEALQACFGAQLRDAVVHGTVSHQHIYGLLFRALWPLAAGRVIAPRKFFLEDIVAALDQPAVLISSPAHLKRIPHGVNWTPARVQLRAIFSSGGALPEEAALATQEQLGHAPIEIYGSSETGGIAWRQLPTSSWTPLPKVEWRIEDGQLAVMSPHLQDASWWRSADRVESVEGGGFRLLGRADRIVKVEERRVSLTTLEHSLQGLPEVVEARVLLLDGARAELAAAVVLSEAGEEQLLQRGRRALGQALAAALAHEHAAVARPRRWRFVRALPMTAQGKVTDTALRDLFRPERPVARWLLREPLLARLTLEIAPELIVFDGHFPQTAILPGVAQLDWAVRFGREAFAIPPHFVRMEVLKFQRTVRPGACIELTLEWLPDKTALAFCYTSAHGTHASGRAVFSATVVEGEKA